MNESRRKRQNLLALMGIVILGASFLKEVTPLAVIGFISLILYIRLNGPPRSRLDP